MKISLGGSLLQGIVMVSGLIMVSPIHIQEVTLILALSRSG
jgi:hypothetical protein